MAYNELIKNFDRIRDYMRQFYVYGFQSRGEYDEKSARSYDNERRRIESWLGDYIGFHRDAMGKQVFLSVDSRSIPHNPLHAAFKAKSFTDKDITFHFYLLDILQDGVEKTVNQLLETIDEEYLIHFPASPLLDISLLRKKLKEYEALGLITSRKQGRELYYRRSRDGVNLASWDYALDYFSEESPLGIIGSYLLDKLPAHKSPFRYKHHYLLHTLESQLLYTLTEAIEAKSSVFLTMGVIGADPRTAQEVVPMKFYISAQTGRQYLLAYHKNHRRFRFYRLDMIRSLKPGKGEARWDTLCAGCAEFEKHCWGVSCGSAQTLDHIELTVQASIYEPHILQRLQREKRCGTVEVLGQGLYRYSADVYDAKEMIPWLRTFIGRITALETTNAYVMEVFRKDIGKMAALYGGDAV